MRTSNPKHPAPNVFCRGIRGFIGGSALGVRRWVFSFIFLFACLGGGFAAPSLSAGELSLSNAATNEVTERALAESDVVALLTDKLQGDYVKDKGDLELRCTRPWKTCTVPNEPLTVNVLELPTAGVTPSFIVRFELHTADRCIGTYTVAVAARIWREVWVAHSTLKRGDAVSNADVVRERRDVLNIRDALADFSAGDDTLELAESVQSNSPLLARMVKPRTVIRRGQAADAVIQDGSLNISMKVEALEDGAPGDTIRMRNPVTHRDLSGKVLNEQTILISL